MNGWAIVEAFLSAVRRGILVEPQIKTLIRPASTLSHPMGEGHRPRPGRHLPSARLMMSLMTELDSFTLLVLQRFQSYGLRRLRALRATEFNCPFKTSSFCPII
jgi:hypothetical protein